jgi:serine/threonine protein kinase
MGGAKVHSAPAAAESLAAAQTGVVMAGEQGVITAFRRESQLLQQRPPDESSFRRSNICVDDLPAGSRKSRSNEREPLRSGSPLHVRSQQLAVGFTAGFSDQELEHQFRDWYDGRDETATAAPPSVTKQARAALGLLAFLAWLGLMLWLSVRSVLGSGPAGSNSSQDDADEFLDKELIDSQFLVALACPLVVGLSREPGGAWNQVSYLFKRAIYKIAIIIIGLTSVMHRDNKVGVLDSLQAAASAGDRNATLVLDAALHYVREVEEVELGLDLVRLGGLGAYLIAFDLAMTPGMVRRILLHCALDGALVLGFMCATATARAASGQWESLALAFALPLALVASSMWTRWQEELALRRYFVGLLRMRRSLDPPTSGSGGSGAARSAGSGHDAEFKVLRNWSDVPVAEDQDLELLEEIGQGAFGPVMRGRYKSETVAVKIFWRGAVANVERLFAREANTMKLLRHPNVVSLFAVAHRLQDGASLALVCEYAPAGSLQDLLTNSEFTWDSARERIVLDIARGMNYLHHFLPGCVVIHHDLKPANVLIGANLEAKINDFGVSMIVARQAGADAAEKVAPDLKTRSAVGSPIWLAPEVHRAEPYNEKIDVYAFSLVLCEALVGDGLFVVKSYSATGQPLPELCSGGFRPTIPESLREAMPGVVQLIEECWADRWTERPAFSHVVARLVELAQGRARAASAAHAHALAEPRLPQLVHELEPAPELEQAEAHATGQDQAAREPALGQTGRGLVQAQTQEPFLPNLQHTHQQQQHQPQGLGAPSKQSSKHAPPRMGPSGAFVHSGRSYSHISLSDPSVLAKVEREFQSEMSEQAAKYEQQLLAQKQLYEEKLSQLASAVL